MAQTIQGTVINTVTNQGLGGVVIELRATGGPSLQTTSDGKGAFQFGNVPAGLYSASLSLDGYFHLSSGSDPLNHIVVTTGAAPVQLHTDLTAYGKISGRVLDADGAPMPGVLVNLEGRYLVDAHTSAADGAFTFDELIPGETVTLVARPPLTAKPPTPEGDQVFRWAATYYPSTTVREASVKIRILSGTELTAQNVKLKALPAHHVRGIVFNDHGDPAPHAVVTIADWDRASTRSMDITTAADGSFDLLAVDGDWLLTAAMPGPEPQLKVFGRLVVRGRDIEREQLFLSPPFKVHGRVVFDAPAAMAIPEGSFGAFLAPILGESPAFGGITTADGTFTIDGAYPGTYRINARTAGIEPFYLSSVRIGEREASSLEVELTSGSAPIVIEYRADGGTVRGSVENCNGAQIKLAPQDPANRRGFTRLGHCEADGRYTLAGVRPGAYYIFAAPIRHPALLPNIELDQALLNQAAKITVAANEVVQVDLRVVTTGR